MKLTIREMGAPDRTVWADMRAALWPEETSQDHVEGIQRVLSSGHAWGFIAETSDGAAAGFAEVAIRPYANGCDSQPVPFLEGIWVKEELRRRGIGAGLIEQIEVFLMARGFRELGSDTPIDNHASQAAHRGWKFSETERVVYFRKNLNG
jgi:aminoglycoside 6'-N-acetyltransferase I